MGKKKKKGSKSKKINISLILSIIAILISLAQVIFENPYFKDYYERTELGLSPIFVIVDESRNEVTTVVEIQNRYRTKVQDLKFSMRLLPHDRVLVYPAEWLDLPDNRSTSVLKYDYGEMAPESSILLLVISDYEEYLSYNRIDTLEYGTIVQPKDFVAPQFLKISSSERILDFDDVMTKEIEIHQFKNGEFNGEITIKRIKDPKKQN